jgi:hypothetical protein
MTKFFQLERRHRSVFVQERRLFERCAGVALTKPTPDQRCLGASEERPTELYGVALNGKMYVTVRHLKEEEDLTGMGRFSRLHPPEH